MISDDAICLRRWSFSETSQTVSVLTREHGIIRGLAKGARREKGSFSGGLDILNRGRVTAIVKPGRDLATLTQWDHERTYTILRSDPAANRVGWYMVELVQRMLEPEDPHPEVFDALVEALETLAEGNPEAVLLRFQWSLLCATGYRPQMQLDAATGGELPAAEATLAFSPSAGGAVADTGEPDRSRARRETIALLQDLDRGDTTDGDPPAMRRANRLLAAYIRFILGVDPPGMRWWRERPES